MPTLEDLPSLQPQSTVAGNDLVAAYDVSDIDGQVKKLRVNQLLGLSPTDVTTISGTSGTISTRVTVCTSTSAVGLTLPAASGNLREVIILKASGTSTATATRAGSDVIVTGSSVTGTTVQVLPGLAARLLSDGTTWYHVSNDA